MPPEVRDRALAEFARRRWKAGGESARWQARQLLELQRATLLMYASCGWFFDDVAGLEGALVIRMGAHALDLLASVGGKPPTAAGAGRAGRGEEQPARGRGRAPTCSGAVARDRVTVAHAVAGAALADAVGAPPVNVGWDVDAVAARRTSGGAGRLTRLGARRRTRRTGAVETLSFVGERAARRARWR